MFAMFRKLSRPFRLHLLIAGLVVVLAALSVPAFGGETVGRTKDAGSLEGYYKDLFVDGGSRLSSRTTLHAAKSLGLDCEYYAGRDEIRQSQIVSGNEDDFNGALLYPDGQPRFRLIYVHGGGATAHGKTLGSAGREAFREFYYNGGSYCGSCAGSFLAGANTDKSATNRLGYLHIFPYNTLNTGMKKERVGHVIPEGSPLLNFRDFGADLRIDDIYHNNGNWMLATKGEHLKTTEILALYDKPDKKVHNGAAIWAHKKSAESGRVVMIGSHPEGAESGERLLLTEACLLYALAGVAPPAIKGELKRGETRVMDKRTSDRDPAFTRIGDRQYHHFTIEVPTGEQDVRIRVNGEGGHQLNLYLRKAEPAFASNAEFSNRKTDADKELRASLSPGTWHVSVECASSIETKEIVEKVGKHDSKFVRYGGDVSVLNGAPYSISWMEAPRSDEK
jgi:hypothetical protein